MSEELRARLRRVRSRQQWLRVLCYATAGLLLASCVALLLALARLFGLEVTIGTALGVPFVGLFLGAIVGVLVRRTWNDAAEAIDSHYGLKDRSSTALWFSQKADTKELHELQMADAIEHLQNVNASQVAPLRLPRTLPFAMAVLTLTVVLVLLPFRNDTASARNLERLPVIVEQGEYLEQTMLKELDELAQEEKDEHVEQLIEELEKLVAELKEPGVDQREALAKLSEMQSAVADAMAEFNLEAVDAKMKELAEAVAPATSMQGVSEALKEGQYSKAAEDFEALDPTKLTRKEKKAVAQNLKKLSKNMRDAGQGQLSDATCELCEGLESDNESQCKGGACKLARLCRRQGLRKSICQCLGCQLNRLAECKSSCSGGNCNGGNCVAKSNSPTNSWGRGASGKPLGEEKTSLDSQRNRQEITGVHGDGPSEREISFSPEGRELATREYEQKYNEFRKMTEAVLDSEPLPLGHRQTVRRYFESIRPQNADLEEGESDGSKTP